MTKQYDEGYEDGFNGGFWGLAILLTICCLAFLAIYTYEAPPAPTLVCLDDGEEVWSVTTNHYTKIGKSLHANEDGVEFICNDNYVIIDADAF